MKKTSKFLLLKLFLTASSMGVFGPLAFGGANMSVSGSLPRDLGQGYFDVDVKLTGLAGTDQVFANTDNTDVMQNAMPKRLRVRQSGSTDLRYDSTVLTDRFYLIAQPPSFTTDASGNQNVTLTVRIQQLGEKLSVSAASGEVVLSFDFMKPDGTGNPILSQNEQRIKVDNTAPNAAPSLDPLVSGNRKLVASWTHAATISYAGVNATNKAPPAKVRMFWIDQSAGNVQLNAYQFKGAEKDVATTCTYDSTATTGQACIKCKSDDSTLIYLSSDQSNNPSVQSDVTSETSKSTPATLDLEKKYAVFIMYEPFGLKQSFCYVEKPTLNYTLTELNGEGEAKQVDFRCFVATAAYGSPLHARLRTFRAFREHVLLKTAIGRAFVRTYYRVSPPLAEFIAHHESLRKGVRSILDHVADWMDGYLNP